MNWEVNPHDESVAAFHDLPKTSMSGNAMSNLERIRKELAPGRRTAIEERAAESLDPDDCHRFQFFLVLLKETALSLHKGRRYVTKLNNASP